MRYDGDTVIAEPSDSATLRAIAGEFGLTVDEARVRLELGPQHAADELLRPRVAVAYRLLLESVRCVRCGGRGGAHGLVHTRHGNGGGSNRPCPSDAGPVR